MDLANYAILFAQFERIQRAQPSAGWRPSVLVPSHQYLAAKEDMEQVARATDLKHQVEAIPRGSWTPDAPRPSRAQILD